MAGVEQVNFPSKVSASAQRLIQGLLRRSPAFRLPMKKGGVKNLKEADWYMDVDWRQLQMQATEAPFQNRPDETNFQSGGAEARKAPFVPFEDDGSGWDAECCGKKGFAVCHFEVVSGASGFCDPGRLGLAAYLRCRWVAAYLRCGWWRPICAAVWGGLFALLSWLERGATPCVVMVSFYQSGWDVHAVRYGEEDDEGSELRQSPARSNVHSTGGYSSGRSPEQPGLWNGHAENYEIHSNASQRSDASWCKAENWSWHSWSGGSAGWSPGYWGRQNENWTWVSRSGQWDNDSWHRWHNGREPQTLGSRDREEVASLHSSGGAEGVREDDGLPSGQVQSVQERVEKDEKKRNTGKVSNSYPPVFKAKQGESYKDWKRAVKFWIKGEGGQLPEELIGPRVMVQLRERAAHLVKHLEPEDVDGPGGLALILNTLEASPLIKQNERHRVDYHRRRLLSLNRMPHESLESYITRAGIYKNQLETLDASLAMGDRFYVGHLLDHSRLTRKDRVMVKARAGGEELDQITAAMVELAPESFAGVPNRFKKAAFVTDNIEENNLEELRSISEPVPEENFGEDSLDENVDNLEVLHAEHEALAMQFRARQKIAEIRKLRNFYKKGDPEERKRLIHEKMKSNPCHTCGEYGHWSRECPKNKSGGNPVLVTKSERGNHEADQWSLLVSLCSPAMSDRPNVQEVYMVQLHMGGGEDHITPVGSHDACWSLYELAKCVILDLGCMRNVVGEFSQVTAASPAEMEVDVANLKHKGKEKPDTSAKVTDEVDLTTPRKSSTTSKKKQAVPILEIQDVDTNQEAEVVDLMKSGMVTLEEARSLVKTRAKKAASSNKKIQNAALTGWAADYPSLSHFWSNEVAFNMVHSMKSRMVTFLWKKLCWQLKVKEAVRQESQSRAKWRKNPRWLSEMLGREVAALYGHYGAMRQRLRAPDAINEKMEMLERAVKMKTHYVLLEIYAGTAMLTRVARRRQRWEVLDPVDLVYGDDLTLPDHRARVLEVVKKEEPDLVTLSPRCGPWSQFQRQAKDTEKVMLKRKEDLVHWRFVREVWDLQDGAGRLVMTENPWQSEALRLSFMESRPHLHRAKVAQCRFGLKDVISGKPHQKYTAFDANNLTAKEYLEKEAECICEPGAHQPIEGCVHYQGATWRRSQLASRWPARLCDHLLGAAARLAEMRKQMGKIDGQGNRYDYIYFMGEARMLPYRIRQVVSQLHVTLGHPSEERLVRMLMVNGGSEELCKAAKGLKCQVCEAVRPPHVEPKVSGRRVTRFNDKLVGDSFFIWDAKGIRFSVTHFIDYHVGLLNKNPNAEDTRELLQNRWCAIFGPPDLLQTDGGKEFAEGVVQLTRVMDFKHDVVPPGAKWRQGQVERHGGILKLMMMRVIDAEQAEGIQPMRLVTTACISAKNRMVNKLGLSPLQAVTGRNTSIPTSLVEQVASGCLKEALNRELQQSDSLRRAERIRAAACDAFHWLDTNEALRRALHSRSRPPRMELVKEGATVYVHAVPPARRGLPRRLQDHKSWDGPGLVVCVERLDGLPKRVWVRIRNKLHSYPLEKIRLATPDEMLGSNYILDAMKEIEMELNKGKVLVQPEEEEEQQPPLPEEPYPPQPEDRDLLPPVQDGPSSVLQQPDPQRGQDAESGGELSDGTIMRLLEEDDEPTAEREQKVRRMAALDDFPADALRPKGGRKVKQLKKGLYQKKAQHKRSVVKARGEAASSSMVFWAEAAEEECVWRQVEEQQDAMEIYLTTNQQTEEIQRRKEEESKRAEEDFQEAKIVTGKARLEYQWKKLEEEWKQAFKQPLLKGVKVYFDHDAVEGVPKDKMIDPRKVLGSRFVLTNKGGATLEEAELKARWILGGHLDPEAGKYPTLAPTASNLGHNLINFMAVQKGWVVHYEDVSAAFLQGHRLPKEREVYVRLPRGYPPYIEEFIREQLGSECRDDLVRLTKGGFGLPESPRLWYLEYKHTLEALGVMEMVLLPGVFRAFHEDGRLRALACIHVDDTRYCGDETSASIWEGLHAKLKFGALRKATEEEVKFCGRWERQCPTTFEFTYSMVPYGEKLYKMKPREEGDSTPLTAAEKLEMSSLVGQLNWQSRQGRYDLAYGVSNVQQLMAKNDPEAIAWLNKVVYRAKQSMVQKIPKIDVNDMVIISASDAAYGSQPGGHSQGGMVIGIGDQRMLDGEGPFCILEASSMKIQRVVRCSMSAEVSMAASSYEHGDFIRASMAEMFCRDFRLRDWKLWGSRWRHFLVIDAKTGFDVLCNESQTSDRKIQIDLAVLKQALTEGSSNSFVKWVPGHLMIADGMTKWFHNGSLSKGLMDGRWSLQDTAEAKELRDVAAKRRKSYKK
eukprot:symbB.v1.2.033789.t1/scaffold4247.1/size72962/1